LCKFFHFIDKTTYFTSIKAVTFSGEYYITFLNLSGALIVYKISDFVSDTCNMEHANKINLVSDDSAATIQQFSSINIDSLFFMLVGFSTGKIVSIDFS